MVQVRRHASKEVCDTQHYSSKRIVAQANERVVVIIIIGDNYVTWVFQNGLRLTWACLPYRPVYKAGNTCTMQDSHAFLCRYQTTAPLA